MYREDAFFEPTMEVTLAMLDEEDGTVAERVPATAQPVVTHAFGTVVGPVVFGARAADPR